MSADLACSECGGLCALATGICTVCGHDELGYWDEDEDLDDTRQRIAAICEGYCPTCRVHLLPSEAHAELLGQRVEGQGMCPSCFTSYACAGDTLLEMSLSDPERGPLGQITGPPEDLRPSRDRKK